MLNICSVAFIVPHSVINMKTSRSDINWAINGEKRELKREVQTKQFGAKYIGTLITSNVTF